MQFRDAYCTSGSCVVALTDMHIPQSRNSLLVCEKYPDKMLSSTCLRLGLDRQNAHKGFPPNDTVKDCSSDKDGIGLACLIPALIQMVKAK